jgi:hypothetical protein
MVQALAVIPVPWGLVVIATKIAFNAALLSNQTLTGFVDKERTPFCIKRSGAYYLAPTTNGEINSSRGTSQEVIGERLHGAENPGGQTVFFRFRRTSTVDALGISGYYAKP